MLRGKTNLPEKIGSEYVAAFSQLCKGFFQAFDTEPFLPFRPFPFVQSKIETMSRYELALE